ncbi:terminase TerL endonuclease subunit [Bauldia litoralis]|uniref:terminase TerL endonuclease subunit n=1 Tax=Bauldia litoralis TaxID=665467 RepID=UPI0032666307
MSAAAVKFLQSLVVPEGPRAGKAVRLAPFQRTFVRAALKKTVSIAALSVARGNGKSAISGGLGLGALLGVWDSQPRREVIIAARTRDQAKICWSFVEGFARSLPDDIQRQLKFRRATREIEFAGNGGGILRAIAAEGRNALGSAPTLAVLDERGHWPIDAGDALEAALLTGLGKRNGKAVLISTSASDDAHPFSRWLDHPPTNAYVQEHRPPPGLAADDVESLLIANPGARHHIGASEKWLAQQAEAAIARGGSALLNFRLLHRNERVTADGRDLLLMPDQWLACETAELPPRVGPCIVGIDLGGSMSMSAAAFFWPETGRLECSGAFARKPSLLDRGQADSVGDRYVQMRDRGELTTIGDAVVAVGPWLASVARQLDGAPIAALCADRYRQAEVSEALDAAGLRCPVVWRGQGFKDGAEDVERFRRAVFDGQVRSLPSLLLRSAFADAVCLSDPAGNSKLVKGRSKGRIDAAAATILAVAQGARMLAAPKRTGRAIWA